MDSNISNLSGGLRLIVHIFEEQECCYHTYKNKFIDFFYCKPIICQI